MTPTEHPRTTKPSPARWALVAVALALVLGVGLGSRRTPTEAPPPSTSPTVDEARGVLHRHRGALLRRYGAVGVGLRRRSLEDPRAVLVVYLSPTAVPPPGEVSADGIPVLFEVTGRTTLFPDHTLSPDNTVSLDNTVSPDKTVSPDAAERAEAPRPGSRRVPL